MRVIIMSRQFFNTLVGMGSRSHDFDDELMLISSSDARSKTFILDLIPVFCTCGIFCALSRNMERIVSILSTKYLEKWSQSDFTDVNSGRAGGGILCRMLFIEFQRRRGLSEFSAITSFYYTGGIAVCHENDLDVCEICAMFVRDWWGNNIKKQQT